MIQNKQLPLTLFLLLLLMPLHISAEQVCKFKYKGTPEELHNSKLKVNEKTVAMSEHIRVSSPVDSISKGTNSSVYFLIDQSGSMQGASNYEPNDQWGSRFTVTSDLIDTIYKVNPNTEIGLCFFWGTLYMDKMDDPNIMNQIDIVDSRKGSYMSLLQLNKEYESKALGTATGYEILKHYLRTDTVYSKTANDYLDIIYKPTDAVISSSQYSGGTNISLGFDAVKKGFESAQYDVDQRFIIFFSDGEATIPKNDTLTMMKYVDGTDVPTTFTVYFTKDNTALENLEIMTENIKTNGYSSTNAKTQLHTIETNHDKLMKLLMDNAIGTILSQVNTNIPIKIDVGSTSKANWDGDGFSFGKLFPLTGVTTDFQFKIEYQLKKDTIRYVRTEFDTVTSNVDFTVEIVEGYQMPDTLEAMYWDRSISFYQNGTEMSTIDPTLGDVEIRFTSTKIDTHYTYSNVKIELTTAEDRELFALEDKGEYHSFTFRSEITAASQNDGVLQFANPDEVTALFKNPELPLDTLLVTISVDGKDEFTITGGTYFDNSADGHVDSIFLAVSPEKRLETVLDEIVNSLSLPAFRNFKIMEKRTTAGGIALSVKEDRSEITTAVTDEDTLTVQETSLSPTALLQKSRFTFIDSVAPIVLHASLVDSVKAGSLDFLTVELSEEPQAVTENTPFKLYKMPGDTPYDVKLSVEKSNSKTLTFRVGEIIGESQIIHGDSLRINWETKGISDGANNVQDNRNNSRCAISVQKIEEGILMQEASYFDKNADGKIDEIAISFYGEYIEENIDEIVDAVTLPSFRNFEKLSHRYENGGVTISVKQNIEESDINSAITDSDYLEIKNEITTTHDMKILIGSVKAVDKMAPVILKAELLDSVALSSQDILTVTFSEAVNAVTEANAFRFQNPSSGNIYGCKTEQSEKNSAVVTFTLLERDIISDKDSIWINHEPSSSVRDLIGNGQGNDKNRKVEIDLKLAKNEIKLSAAHYSDENADGRIDKINLHFQGDLIEENMDALVDAVSLPSNRKFQRESHSYANGVITVFVTQNISEDEINTAVTAEDILRIDQDVELSGKTRLIRGEVNIGDKVAPVIVEAHFIDSVFQVFQGGEMHIAERGMDILMLAFSENILDVSSSKPFNFYAKKSDSEYEVELKFIRKSSDRIYEFQVLHVENGQSIESVDSIWIRNDIGDSEGNYQTNSNNIKREIPVETIIEKSWQPDEVDLILKTTILDPEKEYFFNRAYKGIDGAGSYKGVMIIVIEPKNRESGDLNERDYLKGKLSLFDCVGNTLASNVEMEYDQENRRLIYIWQGKNSAGRKIGSGAYSLVAEVEREFYTKDSKDNRELIETGKILKSSVGIAR